jgi:hypothetical protein
MSTDEIAKTITLLNTETIKDALKQSGSKASGQKQQLVKHYETAVMDVGIEKFVERLNPEQIEMTAKLLSVEKGENQTLKEALVEAAQSKGVDHLLGTSDMEMLRVFSTAMGLELSEDKKEMEKQIADEVMLTGMEGFLNKLNQAVLKKHCTELKLKATGVKKDLVERLMVHIFELEPLGEAEKAEKENKQKAARIATQKEEKVKEEAKPKETKKRQREEPKPEKEATEEKPAVEKREKRATKKKEEPQEEEVEEPKKKKEKVTENGPVEKKPARQPYVAPPLETIVKGKYTAADLHNLFNLTHLQEYCKKEGLPATGPKKKIIKRIDHYLETGEKEEKPKKKKQKKGAKKGAKKDNNNSKSKKGEKASAGAAAEGEQTTTTTSTDQPAPETKA